MVRGNQPNPRRANGYRRDQVRRRVLAEEDTCWLCGGPVDKTLPHGLPGSPELDEVVPVSLGGSPFDRRNVRLAHRRCNQRRGNGRKGRGGRAKVESMVTTRRWGGGVPPTGAAAPHGT